LIVADTNVIAYLLLEGPFTPEARAVYEKDPEWVAPLFWRSEFRNVLIVLLRRGLLSLDDALSTMDRAERLMKGEGYQIDSARVLRLAADSGCSAYDCEFVALAQDLGVPLVTSDRGLIEKFKPLVVSMSAFCA
jgi:predicted nucleic acid-binding protein